MRLIPKLSSGTILKLSLLILYLSLIPSPSLGADADDAPPAVSKSSEKKGFEPFGFADFTWLNGNSRQKYALLESKYFTGQFQLDANYIYSFNHPKDHTLVGSCETGRTNEVQVQQLGIGGDFHHANVRGRLMTQFGMYSQMTPRNDSSPARGQWNLTDAYKYVSEAYGGYHLDIWNGINIDVGIFMSYVGLFSYYQFENWAYQPSYVSANTPWFFNGVRIQTFPTEHLKLEYWIVNGWQSYGMYNDSPGFGMQAAYRPTGSVAFVSNNYYGYDTNSYYTSTTGTPVPSRMRVHTDNSVEVKYLDQPANLVSKAAFSLTVDAGCESGGGVSCTGGAGGPAQNFVGFMLYNRVWLDQDLFGVTLGGGAITNPGRYLVLLPPVDGANAASGSAPFFTQNAGDSFHAWDASITLDYMPSQFVTFRLEFDHRQADVPYFAGPGGLTPQGGNDGKPPGASIAGFVPDLVKSENRINASLLVRL